jgi:hypothetical protein
MCFARLASNPVIGSKCKLTILTQVSRKPHECDKLEASRTLVEVQTNRSGSSSGASRAIELPDEQFKDPVLVGPVREKDERTIEAFPSKY